MEDTSAGWNEGAKLRRKRSYAPRQDINEVGREALRQLGVIGRGPAFKEKYLGNGKHEFEHVTGFVSRLRVPGGWIYNVDDGDSVFVPLPSVLGYAV